MIDKLVSLPRARASVVLLAIPSLVAGGVLAIAVFAPAKFAAWDYFRLTAVSIAITFPLMGLNAQLTGGAMIAIMLPGIQAAAKHEAIQWAQSKKPGRRSSQLTSETYWVTITLATFFAIPVLYVPIIASVFTPMDLRRAMLWAAWAEGTALTIQLGGLIACTILGVLVTRHAKEQATSDVEAGVVKTAA